MKTARERAIDIAYHAMGKPFSRELWRLVIEDKGDAGDAARKLIGAIETGIEKDRADMAKAKEPS